MRTFAMLTKKFCAASTKENVSITLKKKAIVEMKDEIIISSTTETFTSN